ncbi:MAG: hypothetical protein V1861_00365 [Candidatus Micrarchaeota archaeon]
MIDGDIARIRKKMAEKSKVLKPAIAGLIVDNKVDYKEIFATFVQLVVAGHVQLVPHRKFVRVGAPKLLRFEQFVLDAALPDDKPTDEKAVAQRLKGADLFRFSILMLDELVEQGIADKRSSLSMNSPFGSINASSELEVTDNSVYRSTQSTTTYVGPQKKGFLSGLLSAIGIRVETRMGTQSRSGADFEDMRKLMDEVEKTDGEVMVNGKLVTDPAEKVKIKKDMNVRFRLERFDGTGFDKRYEVKDPRIVDGFAKAVINSADIGASVTGFEFTRTDKADVLIKEYLELQDFLKRFPVYEDRFSNEFVGFNIAFHLRGTDKLPS